MRGYLDDPEFVISDGGAEFSSQANAPAPLRPKESNRLFPQFKGRIYQCGHSPPCVT
jgi:hypothetical protein